MSIFCLVILLLVGCAPNSNESKDQSTGEVEENQNQSDQIEDAIKTFEVDKDKFHFIVDWLTDTKIAFVEKDEKNYYLKSFDINSGEIETLFTEEFVIVDVIIHPSKNTYLLHTSNDSSSATIKIVSLDGVVIDEITIASSELAIEWNDMDPTLLLLTAFQKDWSYDLFLYNGNEEDLSLLSLEDPFPKWLGKKKIVTATSPEQPLDTGDLFLYDFTLDTHENLNLDDVVHFDTKEDNLLYVQVNEEELDYKIINEDTAMLSEWSIPDTGNDFGRTFPESSWVSNTTVIMPSSSGDDLLADSEERFKFMRVLNGRQHLLLDHLDADLLRCSPSGEKCIVGYKGDKIVDVIKQKEFNWMTELE